MRNLLRPFSFLPAFFLMYCILTFSGQDGAESSQLSGRVSLTVVRTVSQLADRELTDDRMAYYADRIEGAVRKCAHVLEYFALAVSVAFPLYVYGVRGIALMLAAGTVCVGFAGFDEYRQTLVSGRNGTPRDVLIDSVGVFGGIVLVRIVGFTGRMTIFRERKGRRR